MIHLRHENIGQEAKGGERRQQIAASAAQGASLRCPQSIARLRHGPVSVAAALPCGAERLPGQAGQ